AFDADRTFAGGAATAGSTTFTSSTPLFSARDVHRKITTTTSGVLAAGTYIASVPNSTTVTLSAAASATASGLTFTLGGRVDVDGFVTKLGPSGALVYSTLLGGSGTGTDTGNDEARAIAVKDGFAYVAGTTGSSTFPVQNPLGSYHPGSSDAFLTKLNTS